MTANPKPRYAIYYAPQRKSGLWSTAQRWLGRDCENGQTLTQVIPTGWSADEIARATESPRRYGFHATLKAPFRLAPETTLNDLQGSIAAFATRQQPFEAPPLEVSAIGPFLALTLSEASPQMEALAAEAVQALDSFRAPLSAEDIERRIANGLTPRQQELLRTWGYPYVSEEFRFHMTLSGPLEPDLRNRLKAVLVDLFQVHTLEPLAVDEICLYCQSDPAAPFLLTDRVRLGSPPANRKTAPLQGGIAP